MIASNRSLVFILLAIACGARAARGDIFVLQNGGQVRGEWLNREESPRKTYQIKTSGGRVTLEAAQVKEVRRQTPAELRYDQVRGKYPDTVDGQWALAEWCRENYLSRQRKTHLERIVELEPDHAAARRALGFTNVRGRWMTQEMQMRENGYVRYQNDWVLPQEVEIREQQRKSKAAQAEWTNKLRRWSQMLAGDRADQALENFRAITDPFAAGPLARLLADTAGVEPRRVRLLYVTTLGRLNEPAGMESLVNASLFDADEEIRQAALEEIVANKYQPAVAQYIKALRNSDNGVINRAAVGLGQLKDRSAVGPLIDALVTTHSYQVQTAPPGQMSSSFGTGPAASGGGTFNFGGGGPTTVTEHIENHDVLAALVDLAGVSYNYDLGAWKYWYTAQRKTQTLDTRRDNSK